MRRFILALIAVTALEAETFRSDDPMLNWPAPRNTDTVKGLNEQVSQWDVRLDLRRSALQKQFAGLEVALGKMQQQSSWLAGQLAGLS